ncbi:MAG: CzcE family metal-binding protein [Burkholderiales bacterium]
MLRKLSITLAAGAFSAAFGTGASAGGTQQTWDNPGNSQWARDAATASGGSFMSMIEGHMNTFKVKGQHLGSATSPQSSDRGIELRPGDRYVNVTRGETVLITVGGKSFAWKFDTLGTPVFDLQEIAPKDIDVAGVKVYVGSDPYDQG